MDIDITERLNEWTLFAYKNLFALFSRKAEISQTWKINASVILSSSAKICFVVSSANAHILLFCTDSSTNPCRGLWFNRTNLRLFQNMSVKIYTNFLLSLGGYDFKINNLKDKMRHGIWVHILQNNLASSPL